MISEMKIGNRTFRTSGKTYIMGILNVTPDSFSDGGKWNDMDRAMRHAEQMIAEGADIIDIGGESTRPGHIQITEAEEIDRVVPYIERLKDTFDIPVSIDSYKGNVVKAAIDAGADLVNDIWGLKYDDIIARVIAESGLPCCLMHNRADKDSYTDFVEDVLSDLRESVAIGERAGICRDKIILDPGVGFGKSLKQNLIITKHMDRLMELDLPVLLGTSRKSMIGLTLDLPVDERVEGTIATSVMAAMKGIMFVRVHDIKENKRAIDMTEAIMNSEELA